MLSKSYNFNDWEYVITDIKFILIRIIFNALISVNHDFQMTAWWYLTSFMWASLDFVDKFFRCYGLVIK